MTAGVVFVMAAALSWLVARAFAGVLAHPTLARENHRRASVPTAAGLCLVVAVVAVAGAHAVLDPDRKSVV